MPQIFPMRWVFVYFYSLVGLVMIFVLIRYVYSFKVDKVLEEGAREVEL